MQVSPRLSPCPVSRPGTSGRTEKAERGGQSQRSAAGGAPRPPPAKPLLQKLNTRIPSRSAALSDLPAACSLLAAGRGGRRPATSRVESRRGGVRAPTQPPHRPRGMRMRSALRERASRPSRSGWGVPREHPLQGQKGKKERHVR